MLKQKTREINSNERTKTDRIIEVTHNPIVMSVIFFVLLQIFGSVLAILSSISFSNF